MKTTYPRADKLRARLDVRELMQSFYPDRRINLRKDKQNIRCPFHEDNHPSCSIKRETFYCFTCHAKGGAFELIAAAQGNYDLPRQGGIKGEGFRYALEQAARLLGEDWSLPARPKTKQKRKSLRAQKTGANKAKPPQGVPCETWNERFAIAMIDGDLKESEAAKWADVALRYEVQTIWHRIIDALGEQFGHDLIKAAGLLNRHGRPHPFFEHFLIIPYLDGQGSLSTLRFRDLTGKAQAKMLSLCNPPGERRLSWQPSQPYLAPLAYRGLSQTKHRVLYVVEGEIDAASILACRRWAIASPGATAFQEAWVQPWRHIERVCVLRDSDTSGDQFATTILRASRKLHGKLWQQQHIQVMSAPKAGKDANDYLQQGMLQNILETIEASG